MLLLISPFFQRFAKNKILSTAISSYEKTTFLSCSPMHSDSRGQEHKVCKEILACRKIFTPRISSSSHTLGSKSSRSTPPTSSTKKEDGDESNTDMVSASCFQKTVVTSSHAQMCLDPLISSCSLIVLSVVL